MKKYGKLQFFSKIIQNIQTIHYDT